MDGEKSECEVTERRVTVVWTKRLTMLQTCIPSIRSLALGKSLVLFGVQVGPLELRVPTWREIVMKHTAYILLYENEHS